MKTTNALFGILTIALALATTIQAQPSTLNITLTATYQLPNTVAGPGGIITVSTTKTGTVTSATILKLIAEESGEPFPGGSYLAQDGGNVEVVDRFGDIDDLSSYFTINNTSGAAVASGTDNSNTGQQAGSGIVYTVISFNDGNGNSCTVDGLIHETIAISAQNRLGNQTESVVYSGTVAGYGTVVDAKGNTDTAVFSGTVSGSGTGPAGS